MLSEAALAAHEKVLGANHHWTKASAGVTADTLDAFIDALAERDGPGAADALEHHLKHIESALDIRDAVEGQADIRRVFAR